MPHEFTGIHWRDKRTAKISPQVARFTWITESIWLEILCITSARQVAADELIATDRICKKKGINARKITILTDKLILMLCGEFR